MPRSSATSRREGPHRHDDPGDDGPDHGVRQVPHAQVRSHHQSRVLPDVRVLQSKCGRQPRRRSSTIPTPTPEQVAHENELRQQIAEAKDKLNDVRACIGAKRMGKGAGGLTGGVGRGESPLMAKDVAGRLPSRPRTLGPAKVGGLPLLPGECSPASIAARATGKAPEGAGAFKLDRPASCAICRRASSGRRTF